MIRGSEQYIREYSRMASWWWYGHQYEMDLEAVMFYVEWHAWPIVVQYSRMEDKVNDRLREYCGCSECEKWRSERDISQLPVEMRKWYQQVRRQVSNLKLAKSCLESENSRLLANLVDKQNELLHCQAVNVDLKKIISERDREVVAWKWEFNDLKKKYSRLIEDEIREATEKLKRGLADGIMFPEH